jgi:hypothetical protein
LVKVPNTGEQLVKRLVVRSTVDKLELIIMTVNLGN